MEHSGCRTCQTVWCSCLDGSVGIWSFIRTASCDTTQEVLEYTSYGWPGPTVFLMRAKMSRIIGLLLVKQHRSAQHLIKCTNKIITVIMKSTVSALLSICKTLAELFIWEYIYVSIIMLDRAFDWISSWRMVYVYDIWKHYGDVIMGTISSQITSLTIVYSTVYSDADQREHQSSRHWPLCGEFPAQMASNTKT